MKFKLSHFLFLVLGVPIILLIILLIRYVDFPPGWESGRFNDSDLVSKVITDTKTGKKWVLIKRWHDERTVVIIPEE